MIKWSLYLTLTSMCYLDGRDLNFVRVTSTHNGEHLCQDILKSLYAHWNFTQDKRFSMTSQCELDLWPRDLVQTLKIVNISMKFHTSRWYAPNKKRGLHLPAYPSGFSIIGFLLPCDDTRLHICLHCSTSMNDQICKYVKIMTVSVW
jgi:hypothetical protein